MRNLTLLLVSSLFFAIVPMVEAGIQFGGDSLRDTYREINSRSTVGYMTGCGDADDTQVLFWDVDDCAGDNGHLYDKTDDHLSVGPDAALDAALTNPPLGNDGGYVNQIVNVLDHRTTFPASLNLGGIVHQLKASPSTSSTPVFDGTEYQGVISQIVVDGSMAASPNNDINANSPDLRNLFLGYDVNMSGASDRWADGGNMTNIYVENDVKVNDYDSSSHLNFGANNLYSLGTGMLGSTGTPFHSGFDYYHEITTTSTGGIEDIRDTGIECEQFYDTVALGVTVGASRTICFDGTQSIVGVSGALDSLQGFRLSQALDGASLNSEAIALNVTGLGKSGAGTVPLAITADFGAPSESGAGSVTEMYTVRLNVPSTGTTENAGIRFLNGTSNLIEFEGATANAFETRFSLTEPTADRTITIPNATGTIALTSGDTDLTITKADPCIIFDVVTATDTDYWIGVQDDAGSDDDDTLQIGDGTVCGSNTHVTLTTAGSMTVVDINTGNGAVELAAGQWSPTPNDIANLDASSSAAEGQYLRVGATVSASVQLTVNPTLTATSTQTELDLPVVSNFGATSDAAGTCASPGIAGQVAAVTADAASNEVEVRWIAGDITSQEMDCVFAYQVI